MNKYYADFNSDPLFLSGEANKKMVKAQIANNNALLQQQKKGGMGTLGNMPKQSSSKQYEIASTPVSNQNKQSTTLGAGNSGRYSYDPKTGQTIRQPSVLTQSNGQGIMKADRKALHQELFKQSEDMLGRLFLDALEGRETPKYLLQSIPQQEEKQNELSAEQEYAFWEGFGFDDEDERLQSLSRANASMNSAKGSFRRDELQDVGNSLQKVLQNRVEKILNSEKTMNFVQAFGDTADAVKLTTDARKGIFALAETIGKEKWEKKVERNSSQEVKKVETSSAMGRSARKSVSKYLPNVASEVGDIYEVARIYNNEGTSNAFQAKVIDTGLDLAIGAAATAATGAIVAAVGAVSAPVVLAIAAIGVAEYLLTEYATDTIVEDMFDGSWERAVMVTMPTDPAYYQEIAEYINYYGEDIALIMAVNHAKQNLI